MRGLIILLFAICVSAKINLKALTESMGQEVIEIGAPIKELSPDLEEEPSAENDDDKTTTTIQVATTKDIRKVKSDPLKKTKDIDRIDGKKQEDEEARIEKELAELYKDSIDYSSDSAEVTDVTQEASTNDANTTDETEKPIARARTNFKFQPDSNNPRDVERFRTSVDDINCDRVKLIGTHGERKSGTNDFEGKTEIEIYGEYNDYKTVIDEITDNKTSAVTKDIARARTSKKKNKPKYRFIQPNPKDPKDIARFRTSQDYWHCDMLKLTGMISTQNEENNIGNKNSCIKLTTFVPLLLLSIIACV